MAHGDAALARAKQEVAAVWQALKSGDRSKIDAVRGAKGSWNLSNGADEYREVFDKIAQDIVNLGGLSPETQAMIAARKPADAGAKDVQRISNSISGQLKYLSKTLPTVTNLNGDKRVELTYKPEGMDFGTFLQRMTANKAIDYQDPTSQQQVKNYLATTNPALFRAYSLPNAPAQVGPGKSALPPSPGVTGTPPPAPGPARSPLSLMQQIQGAAKGLSWDAMQRQMPAAVRNVANDAQLNQAMGGSAWMQQYLNTAAQGLGGSRAQQSNAQRELANLEAQANSNKGLLGYLDTVKRIVNPITAAEGSSLIGNERASKTALGSYRRGGYGIRNAGLL